MMNNDKIVIENIEDPDDGEIGEIHIKGNRTGVSFDFVDGGGVVKSMWLTIDDILEKMH